MKKGVLYVKMISFVIPCYCSVNTIKDVVQEIIEVMKALIKYDYEIILINDCSPDNTFEVIYDICNNNSRIKGINLAKNFSQHNALMSGLQFIQGEYVVCLDDDGQSPIDKLQKFIKVLEQGADVVMAKYLEKKQSNFKNMGSSINDLMARYLLNKPRNFKFSSFFVCKRFVVDAILKYENPYPYIHGMILNITKNIVNIEVENRDRKNGKSGYTLIKLLRLWLNGFTSFSVKPLRVATIIGSTLFVVSTIVAFILLCRKIFNPAIQMGYTSIMLTIIFFGAVQLLCIGLLGEYIGRIFICINKSPQYVIKEVINIEKDEFKFIRQGEQVYNNNGENKKLFIN
jgi:undecaprenyl-phosphate 4-deoxy-4-formamido-L-arabinose transferase